MPSYLEIALRVIGSPQPASDEPRPAAHMPHPTSIPVESGIAPLSQPEQAALCGSPKCAGCYEVQPGVRIHPPNSGQDRKEWLSKWEPKGRVQ
jgi:hypothetical protein